MNNMVFVIYALFYISAFLCIGIGIYLLYININTLINKLAFLLCGSLSCWCYGIVRSLMALNYEDSMIWRRFAAIGIGAFYSFLLHYIIILTGKENSAKKEWVKFVIYFPAVIMVYLFAISDKVTQQLYQLQRTSIGWISTTDFNLWIAIYDIFVYGILLVCLYMIYRWKVNTNDVQKKKRATLILFSLLLFFVVALITEILDQLHFNNYLHEVAPIIMLLPMIHVCYAIKKHDFMKAIIVKEDIIFMEQFRTKITRYLAGSFCAGGVIYFISECMNDRYSDFNRVFSFSLLLALFGFGVYMVQRYLRNRELKILLYSLILSIAIPVITLRFLQSASITVWAFPFIIIIAALLFNNSTILTMISTSVVLTQLYIWIKVPNCAVVVETSDYFGRIGLMGMAVCLTYYINKVYLLRLSQLSDRIRTQDLLFLISSRIININNDNLNEKMEEVLSLLCKHINADRAHIYYKNPQNETENMEYFYWCNENCKLDNEIKPDSGIINTVCWKNDIAENGIIQIPDVSKLPKEVKREKELLMEQNVKSMLAVPLINNKQINGYLRIDFVLTIKKWDDEFIKLLTTVGNILGEFNIKADSEKKMQQMVYYDQLTNIPNRELFGKCIDQAIKRAAKNGDLFGIILLDLDSFKTVNDTMGHHCGDKVLIMIADRLEKCLRKTDMVCRFGGDEFLILLNGITSNKDIESVVTKIIKQFEEPLIIEEQEFFITASVGISSFPIDGMDKDTLIKNADIAMYEAKNNGKNQFVFCSKEMKEDIQQTMILTNSLYHAQERGELEIAYQPQVLIKSGAIIAAEALARWNHPDLGNISPALFIPIAEQTGLINSIGEWILRESCKQNKIWQEMGLPPVRIAVNVSVKQLLKPDFVDKVAEILKETELEPRYLELEITENIAIQESGFIFDVLYRLKATGISLAIDDFGIEYSSLNRIKMLPIDRLKIDMHFIRGILNNEKDKVIVDVIIKLAKDLHLKVIAEGVEEEEQLNYLKQKKCDEVQGYYFYKPLSKEKFEEILGDSNQ